MSTKKKKKKKTTEKKVVSSYTSKGKKIVQYSDGSKTVDGKSVSSSSSSSSPKTTVPTPKETQLAILNKQLKDLQDQLVVQQAKEAKTRDLTIGTQPSSLKDISIATAKGIKLNQSNVDKGEVEKMINEFVESTMDSVIGSGKTISTGLTDEDIAAIDVSNFMKQAEANISKEYLQKFNDAKNTLFNNLKDIDYDYAKSITGIETEAKDTKISGLNTLADSGLAFSSNRNKFESDLVTAEEKAKTAAEETARRSALQFGTSAESLLGTDYIKKLDIPSVGGTTYNKFSKDPVIGSLNTEKTYAKNLEAKSLALDEANRRSYATRSLSFQ